MNSAAEKEGLDTVMKACVSEIGEEGELSVSTAMRLRGMPRDSRECLRRGH